MLGMVVALAGCASRPETTASTPPVTQEVAIRPVLVDVLRNQPRTPSNGGSAVILLTPASPRNAALCAILHRTFSATTLADARVGLRRDANGEVEALRPVYWPTTAANPPAATCEQRLRGYDFPRATGIRNTYQLTGPGPYLLVVDATGARASSVDLNGKTGAEMTAMVEIFRDAFAYDKGIWDPAATPRLRSSVAAGITSRGFAESVLQAFSFAVAPAARAGCAIGDTRDLPC